MGGGQGCSCIVSGTTHSPTTENDPALMSIGRRERDRALGCSVWSRTRRPSDPTFSLLLMYLGAAPEPSADPSMKVTTVVTQAQNKGSWNGLWLYPSRLCDFGPVLYSASLSETKGKPHVGDLEHEACWGNRAGGLGGWGADGFKQNPLKSSQWAHTDLTRRDRTFCHPEICPL